MSRRINGVRSVGVDDGHATRPLRVRLAVDFPEAELPRGNHGGRQLDGIAVDHDIAVSGHAKGPSGNKVCILARAPGGQMRGAATQAMPVCIVEERQQSRYAPLPPRPSGLRPAGPLAVLLAPYIPHRVCSSLAPCQRSWVPAAKCTPYYLTGPWPPISQIRRKDLPQISRITRVFEFFGPLAVWLQIK